MQSGYPDSDGFPLSGEIQLLLVCLFPAGLNRSLLMRQKTSVRQSARCRANSLSTAGAS